MSRICSNLSCYQLKKYCCKLFVSITKQKLIVNKQKRKNLSIPLQKNHQITKESKGRKKQKRNSNKTVNKMEISTYLSIIKCK